MSKMFSMRLNDTLQKRLDETSRETGLSKTKIIEFALEKYLDSFDVEAFKQLTQNT